MKLFELLDSLVTLRKSIPNTDLLTEVSMIEVGTNDAIIIKLSNDLIFLKEKK